MAGPEQWVLAGEPHAWGAGPTQDGLPAARAHLPALPRPGAPHSREGASRAPRAGLHGGLFTRAVDEARATVIRC